MRTDKTASGRIVIDSGFLVVTSSTLTADTRARLGLSWATTRSFWKASAACGVGGGGQPEAGWSRVVTTQALSWKGGGLAGTLVLLR